MTSRQRAIGAREDGTHRIRCHLDRLLTDRDMTLTELAERVGVSVVNLSVLKNDRARAVRFSTLTAVCDALGCQPGDLFSVAAQYSAAHRPLPDRSTLRELSVVLRHRDDRDRGASRRPLRVVRVTSSNGEPLVRLSGVNKWFGELHVLQDIDLEIARGEVVVVIGPSGSGKSTLCRTINRLESIEKGEITHRRQAAAGGGQAARPSP